MLIPVCCFSCGACIGHLWETYQQLVKQYREELENKQKIITLPENPEVKEVFVKRIQNVNTLGKPSAEELALITLNIKRMCCRRMFLTQSDTYNLVNLTK